MTALRTVRSDCAVAGRPSTVPDTVGLGLFLADEGRRFGHLGGPYGFTSAFDVSALDDLDNGFEAVLPALAGTIR